MKLALVSFEMFTNLQELPLLSLLQNKGNVVPIFLNILRNV